MLRIDIEVEIVTYKENEIYIVYAPELDLSGYDKTLAAAHESFKTVLEEYIKYGIEYGTLVKDLNKHGWTIKQGKLKRPSKDKIKNNLKNKPPLSNTLQQNYQIELA